jgi:ABC-type multidrug transport system, ATPase and permease components
MKATLPEPEHRQPLKLALLRRVFRQTPEARPVRNVLLVLTVLRAIQLPALAWALGAVINGPIASRSTTGLLLGIAGYTALLLATNVVFHYRIKLALQFGEAVVSRLRGDLFRHFMRMPLQFHHNHRVGGLISRLTSDIEAIRAGVQDALFVSVVQGGQMIVAGLLMLCYEPMLFLIVAAVGPVLLFLTRRFRRSQSRAQRAIQESFSRITASVSEAVGGIRVTQGFSREEQNAGIFRELVADHSQYNIGAARNTAIFTPLLELNAQFFTAALLLAGGWRALNPEIGMPIGDLIMFLFLATLFFQPFQVLGNQYGTALAAMAGAERVFRLLDTPPAWEDPADARALGPIAGRVEVENLTFAYGTGNPVLEDISFTAEPGMSVALVGHTGSGKTTLVNLIAKFYLPRSGVIKIDGHPTTSIRTDSLHSQLGVVTQQNFLFTGTVLENLRLARPEVTEADALAAAERLGCRDEIEAIGLHTVVAEQGRGISLGQRQLVCILRAMLADPRILILDEATSAVDSLTEAKIQQALTELLRGRTSFIIAHRLSTIRKAGLVLVLDRGRIIERGTHRELFRAGGVYAGMYRQFARGGGGPAQRSEA